MLASAAVSTLICCCLDGRPAGAAGPDAADAIELPGIAAPVILARTGPWSAALVPATAARLPDSSVAAAKPAAMITWLCLSLFVRMVRSRQDAPHLCHRYRDNTHEKRITRASG